MAHQRQVDFCLFAKSLFPEKFRNVDALDCGSLDINGNNRYLFTDSRYTGIDIGEGKNVDVVCKACVYRNPNKLDTIISTEMLEHDCEYVASLKNMYHLLKPGGLLLITAAGTGRPEHGTKRTDTGSSPFTTDYYLNITNKMFEEALPRNLFKDYALRQFETDLQFYGIKI